MVPSIVYEFLRFLFFFGITAFLTFCIIYKIEKRYKSPYFLDNNYKNFWHSGFWQSLVCFTKYHKKWLFLPLFFYCVLACFEILSEETFSRIITVYDDKDTVNYSKRIILLPQTLDNGVVINPFDKEGVIDNKSKRKLVLKRNTYSKSYSHSDYSNYIIMKIEPNTIFYCEDNFPKDYILEVPPTVRSTRSYEDRVVWSLEIAK